MMKRMRKTTQRSFKIHAPVRARIANTAARSARVK